MTTSLVTGGAGFIGSHVAENLQKMGYEVVILDDLSGGSFANVPDYTCFVKGSILDVDLIDRIFKDYRPDFVFHLAAYAAENLSHWIRHYNYEVNVLGSVNLINAAVNYGVKRFVFTSSAAVYGDNAHGANEEQTPTPLDPYGIAKYTVEMDLALAHRTFGLPYTIFRLHNLYGPRQNLTDGYRNVIAIFCRQALRDEPFSIYGDGRQQRQFTFIDDVAPHIARCVEMPKTAGEIYNLGADLSYPVNGVAASVAAILGKNGGLVNLPARDEADDIRVNHSKAYRTFDLTHKTPFVDGIEKMARWAATQKLGEPKAFTAIEIEKGLPEHWQALTRKVT